MTVGELKKLLESVSDDVVVVTGGSDHSYLIASAHLVQAERVPNAGRFGPQFIEHHGEEHQQFPVENVLVIDAF